jgi:hypothetical protein
MAWPSVLGKPLRVVRDHDETFPVATISDGDGVMLQRISRPERHAKGETKQTSREVLVQCKLVSLLLLVLAVVVTGPAAAQKVVKVGVILT